MRILRSILVTITVLHLFWVNPSYTAAAVTPVIPDINESGIHIDDIVAYIKSPAGQNINKSSIQSLLHQIDKVDVIAPIISTSSPTTAIIGATVLARSSEAGFLYLVSNAVTANLISLEAAVENVKTGKKVIVQAGVDATLSTSTLDPGAYHLYAVDPTGNISSPTSFVFTVVPTPGTVSGIIKNLSDEALLPDVNVSLNQWNGSQYVLIHSMVTTNENGEYMLSHVPVGTRYRLVLEKPGYLQQQLADFEVTSGEQKVLNFTMTGPIISNANIKSYNNQYLDRGTTTEQHAVLTFTLTDNLNGFNLGSDIKFEIENVKLDKSKSWKLYKVVNGAGESESIADTIGVATTTYAGVIGNKENSEVTLHIKNEQSLLAGSYLLRAASVVTETAFESIGEIHVTVDGYYEQGFDFALKNPEI